jgi:hypothetical protein
MAMAFGVANAESLIDDNAAFNDFIARPIGI